MHRLNVAHKKEIIEIILDRRFLRCNLSRNYRNPLTPSDYRDMIEYMDKNGLQYPYDIVKISFDSTRNSEKEKAILDFKDAGVNWWLELVSDWDGSYDKIRDIIMQGPTQI